MERYYASKNMGKTWEKHGTHGKFIGSRLILVENHGKPMECLEQYIETLKNYINHLPVYVIYK